MAVDQRTKAFSGPRCKILFDGTNEAGWATGVNGTATYQLQRVDVLGDHKTQEIEIVGLTVSLTLDFVRMLNKSLKQMGIRREGSTAEIVDTPSMTIEVYDKVGDRPVYRVKGLKFETLSFRCDARGLCTTNASMQGTDFEEVTA